MPTMLISSTCHDLKDLRDFLDLELGSYGFETLLSDRGTLVVDNAKHSYENCLDAARNCDVTVGVIDGRFGGEYLGTGKSITQVEIETALDAGKEVQVFVRRSVLTAKEVLKPYIGSAGSFQRSKVVDDERVFRLIDSLSRRKTGNWMHGFETPREILFVLSKQLGFALRPDSAVGQGEQLILIDVEVRGPSRHVRLSRGGVGPVRAGEFVRLFGSSRPAAFLYLLWLGSDGQVTPVFPWSDFEWGTRPPVESPRSDVAAPSEPDMGWELTDDPPGMEALILLARPTPLSAGEETLLRAVFEGNSPQRLAGDEDRVSWFEDGCEVQRWRPRGLVPGAKPIDTPKSRLASLLGGPLARFAPANRAVTFARV